MQDQPKPDIRQLGERELPKGKFPAEVDRFRVFLDPAVHASIQEHAQRDLSVEIGGVLVGNWEQDAGGPFVAVRHVIRSELAASGAGELTFTHEAWAEIHKVMDADHANAKIVGWYHTHPDFGIFLSERDQFIHEHFFSDPGQIAYVVDPVRNQEGMFVWRGGRPVLCQHYWVGDDVRLQPEPPESVYRPASTTAEEPTLVVQPSAPAPNQWLLLGLLGVLFFLIGYLLADRMGTWQRQRLVDGVVAHFGTMRILRPGLKQNLEVVVQELQRQGDELEALRPKNAEDAANLSQAELERWAQRLADTQAALRQIEAMYCYDEMESAALARLLDEEFARLRGGLGQPAPHEQPVANKSAATGVNASAASPATSPAPLSPQPSERKGE